jgi:hypothetical protein
MNSILVEYTSVAHVHDNNVLERMLINLLKIRILFMYDESIQKKYSPIIKKTIEQINRFVERVSLTLFIVFILISIEILSCNVHVR